MRSFIVWNVFGMSRGSVRLLATFHYREKGSADALASRTDGGFVLKARAEREPEECETFAEPDASRTATATARVATAPVDTLPGIAPVRNVGWTG